MFFFFFFFFSWVGFVRICCGKTTIEIKLAIHNFKNLTLICNFCFRRSEVGDPVLQNTAAASALVSGFAEQNSSSGSPSTWHRTTRVWWHCIYWGKRFSAVCVLGTLQNKRGLCFWHWRSYSLWECYPGFRSQWSRPLVITKGMFLETTLLFNGCS